jgi:hypothetical protein
MASGAFFVPSSSFLNCFGLALSLKSLLHFLPRKSGDSSYLSLALLTRFLLSERLEIKRLTQVASSEGWRDPSTLLKIRDVAAVGKVSWVAPLATFVLTCYVQAFRYIGDQVFFLHFKLALSLPHSLHSLTSSILSFIPGPKCFSVQNRDHCHSKLIVTLL